MTTVADKNTIKNNNCEIFLRFDYDGVLILELLH